MKGVEKELSGVTGMLLLLTEVLGSECTHSTKRCVCTFTPGAFLSVYI